MLLRVLQAITIAPVSDPTLFELRSLVRASRRDFKAALDDAYKAKDLVLAAESSESAASGFRMAATVREARALTGMPACDATEPMHTPESHVHVFTPCARCGEAMV